MKKVWDKIVEVLSAIWKGIKFVCVSFFNIFNTKEKLAAIVMAIFTWHTLPLNLQGKLQVFALFFVLGAIIIKRY